MGILTNALGLLVPDRKQAVAAAVPSWDAQKPQYSNQPYQRLASQGYMLDEIVFACVEAIATSASEPKWALYLRGSDEKFDKPTDHPVLALLNAPNPFLDGATLLGAELMYMMIGGNSYIEKVRSGAGKLVELWTLRPDRTRVVPDSRTFIGGYTYTIGDNSYTLPPDDVIHCKTRHPLDDYYGLAPLGVLAGRVDLDVWQRQFTEAFFRNAGVPAGLLNVKRSVTNQERDMIRQRFREQYGGPSGWHQLMVIDGGEAEYTKMAAEIGTTITDSLDFANEARICMAYGVPPSIISTRVGMNSSSYANRKSDRELFWQGTLAPIYRYLGSKFTSSLRRDFPEIERIEIDLSTVQALQEDVDALFTRWLNVLEKGAATREEVRMKLGLPETPDEPGTYYVPIRSVPTPSDMEVPMPTPGLSPRQQAQQDAVDASGAQHGLTDSQMNELLPGEGKVAMLTNGRTNGYHH